MNAREYRGEPVEVHRFLQAVADCLRDERVIRYLTIAGNIFEARSRIRECRSQQVVRQHPLQLRRNLFPASISWNRKRDGRVPSPARLEDRSIKKCLHQDVARRVRMQIPEHIREWK